MTYKGFYLNFESYIFIYTKLSVENPSNIVPLSELGPGNENYPNLSLDLRGQVSEEMLKLLGLDVVHMINLMEWAGIKKISIDDSFENVDSPMIVGVDDSGVAIGGKVKQKIPDDQESKEAIIGNKNIIWDNVRASIGQVNMRVLEKEGGINSLENWAEEIDKSLKLILRESGCKQLFRVTLPEIGMTTFAASFPTLFSSIINSRLGYPYGIDLIIMAILPAIPSVNLIDYSVDKLKVEFWDKIFGVFDKDEGPVKLSLIKIFGMELDRALIFWLLLNSRRLIIPIIPPYK